jgi:N6-L-threonylcarbamoyladenine synthase
MKILSIETSCDETAISIVSASGTLLSPRFTVLGNALFSQASIHAEFGGVFPNVAKREHVKNIPPLLLSALKEAKQLKERKQKRVLDTKIKNKLRTLLVREEGSFEILLDIAERYQKPSLDTIAVTFGPGLEPALWVGISFAKALGLIWNVPVMPVNHMEGHIISVLLSKEAEQKKSMHYPALALLISGGHTELVYAKAPLSYKTIGKTRDDAVGEAYDKAARMMNLPYPGGPEISKLAESARQKGYTGNRWNLPRPMLHTKDYDFSFSGLKTAVLYRIREHGKLSAKDKESLAKEFEDAVREVLIEKTRKAIEVFKPKSLIVGGGVIANTHIRESCHTLAGEFPHLNLFIPSRDLATDNSVMIAMAGYLQHKKHPKKRWKNIIAKGNAAL